MKKTSTFIKLLLAALLVLSGLESCQKIIDISIPEQDRKIVVNSRICANQPVYVELELSNSVLDNDYLFAKGFDVNLYNGNNLIGKLKEIYWGGYTMPGFIPQVGQSFRLTASGTGLKPVEATAFIPDSVPVIDVKASLAIDDWGDSAVEVRVKFSDPAGVRNYYRLGADITYKLFDTVNMAYSGKRTQYCSPYWLTDEFLSSEAIRSFDGSYIDDRNFDGKTIDIGSIFPINQLWYASDSVLWQSDTLWLNIKLEQVEQSYYQFVNSLYLANNSDGIFFEPVQVFTNVTGGLGIFAGSAVASFPLTVCTGGSKMQKQRKNSSNRLKK